MKRIALLTLMFAGLSFTAKAQITNSNNITVRVYLTDTQVEDLRFLRRYYGQTSVGLQAFATNLVGSVNWKPEVQAVLASRRDRLVTILKSMPPDDSTYAQLETVLALPPMTNKVEVVTEPAP